MVQTLSSNYKYLHQHPSRITVAAKRPISYETTVLISCCKDNWLKNLLFSTFLNMPLKQYGVWKANPVHYVIEHDDEDSYSPHLSLYYPGEESSSAYFGRHHHSSEGKHSGRKKFKRNNPGRGGNKEIPGLCRAAINIKSTDTETRLAYWMDDSFDNHPIVNQLAKIPMGFKSLKNEKPNPAGMRLDYIRSNIFNVDDGRILPHDEPGADNDIIDFLEPKVQEAIEQKATIYLFGEPFSDRKGIHDVHMNQGNIENFERDDGVYQDGGLLINYPSGQWVGLFIGFASQAVHTDEESGHAITTETWADYLDPEGRQANLIENSVIIDEAAIDTSDSKAPQGRRRSVTLTNTTNHQMPLSTWKLQNSAGQSQALPNDAALGAMSTKAFDTPDLDLSTLGDTITLLNEKGLKVDGVSYRPHQDTVAGQSLVFSH